MRVLLDECLPRRLKNDLPGHEVETVPEAGWAGRKNGELLQWAASAFEVFLTVDTSIEFQQNVALRGERNGAGSQAALLRGGRGNGQDATPDARRSTGVGGELRPLRGWHEGDRALAWSADGRAILANRLEMPEASWVIRFDLAKGVPEALRKLTLADRVGAFDVPVPVVTPDGRYYAYQQVRQLCDLYLVDGLR